MGTCIFPLAPVELHESPCLFQSLSNICDACSYTFTQWPLRGNEKLGNLLESLLRRIKALRSFIICFSGLSLLNQDGTSTIVMLVCRNPFLLRILTAVQSDRFRGYWIAYRRFHEKCSEIVCKDGFERMPKYDFKTADDGIIVKARPLVFRSPLEDRYFAVSEPGDGLRMFEQLTSSNYI